MFFFCFFLSVNFVIVPSFTVRPSPTFAMSSGVTGGAGFSNQLMPAMKAW